MVLNLKINIFFSFHFPENRGGSDPNVKNVSLFLMKASFYILFDKLKYDEAKAEKKVTKLAARGTAY